MGIQANRVRQRFSSEKLLCKDLLMQAHKMLDVKTILVAAPRRTVIYAAANDLNDERLELSKTVVAETLADGSFRHQKISPLIFRFENGELVGALIVKQVQQQ